MPKRIMDGEGMWHSDKIGKLEPISYRAEYAWLHPLALDNGCFEFSPDAIYANCYAQVRPDITRDDVQKILAEFERCGLLFRFTPPEGGKPWAYWTGSERPGRLPPPVQRIAEKRNIAPKVPQDQLEEYLTKCGNGFNGSRPIEESKPKHKTKAQIKPIGNGANGKFDPVAKTQQDEKEQMSVARIAK